MQVPFDQSQDLERAQNVVVNGNFIPQTREFLDLEQQIEAKISTRSSRDANEILNRLKDMANDVMLSQIHTEIKILMSKVAFDMLNSTEIPMIKFCSEILREVDLDQDPTSLRSALLLAYACFLKAIIIKQKIYMYPEGSETQKFLLKMAMKRVNRGDAIGRLLSQSHEVHRMFENLREKMINFYDGTRLYSFEYKKTRANSSGWKEEVSERLSKSATQCLKGTSYFLGVGMPEKAYWKQLIIHLGGLVLSNPNFKENNDQHMDNGIFIIARDINANTEQVATWITDTTFLGLIKDIL